MFNKNIMISEKLKKYFTIFGVDDYTKIEKGFLENKWRFQFDKILNSKISKEKKNKLLIRLNTIKDIFLDVTEEELINLSKNEFNISNNKKSVHRNINGNYEEISFSVDLYPSSLRKHQFLSFDKVPFSIGIKQGEYMRRIISSDASLPTSSSCEFNKYSKDSLGLDLKDPCEIEILLGVRGEILALKNKTLVKLKLSEVTDNNANDYINVDFSIDSVGILTVKIVQEIRSYDSDNKSGNDFVDAAFGLFALPFVSISYVAVKVLDDIFSPSKK